MIKPFFPALLRGTFETEQAAINDIPPNIRQLSGEPRSLVGGGHLYIINDNHAFVLLPTPEKTVELWLTGADFACDTREDALDAIEEFDAVEELGTWDVFELKKPN
jgi:hypothetical protein